MRQSPQYFRERRRLWWVLARKKFTAAVAAALDAAGHSSLYNYLVNQLSGYAMATSDRLDATFAALADPTRRAILTRLAAGDASVLELAEPFAMTQPAVSKHLKVLERAGLISRGRDAQRRPCRIEPRALAEANGWIENYRRLWQSKRPKRARAR
jgi:DNA-binding transcriptional ArsR family regulator